MGNLIPEFIPGLQLSEGFYWDAVRPILDRRFPGLPHAAALLGYGSDVIGFDTPVSRDHMWGPRMLLFLQPADFASQGAAIHETLRQELPVRYKGYSTHYGKPDEEDGGTRAADALETGPVDHLIFLHTLESFWQQELGFSASAKPDAADWLTFQEHRLLTTTGGKVFHDAVGLEDLRQCYYYYPHEVWLYLLKSQWDLISQEEAFVGRTHSTGDELGSMVITARQVERLMRLCFLMEKRYAPYSKWLGTAFRLLACYPQMGPLLEGALRAADYAGREQFLARAYSLAVELHNALGITPPLSPQTRTYSGWHMLRGGIDNVPLDHPGNTRPHQVIFAGRISDAIRAAIHDPQVLALDSTGSVNQFMVESSDALQNIRFCRAIKDKLAQPAGTGESTGA